MISGSVEALALASRDPRAPELLLVECASALWVKSRRGELNEAEVLERIRALESSPLTFVSGPELVAEAGKLALRIAHPVYDCLYLALAVQEDGVVVTADRRFLRAVHSEGTWSGLVEPLVP